MPSLSAWDGARVPDTHPDTLLCSFCILCFVPAHTAAGRPQRCLPLFLSGEQKGSCLFSSRGPRQTGALTPLLWLCASPGFSLSFQRWKNMLEELLLFSSFI